MQIIISNSKNYDYLYYKSMTFLNVLWYNENVAISLSFNIKFLNLIAKFGLLRPLFFWDECYANHLV